MRSGAVFSTRAISASARRRSVLRQIARMRLGSVWLIFLRRIAQDWLAAHDLSSPLKAFRYPQNGCRYRVRRLHSLGVSLVSFLKAAAKAVCEE